MFLYKETKDKFGYDIHNLSRCTKKIVIVQCDYCDNIYERPYIRINCSCSQINKKHCCSKKSCALSKRNETNIKKYGVKNVTQNKIVKEKQKQTLLNKYGVDNISKIPEFVEKKRETYRKKSDGKLILEWAKDLGKTGSTMGQMIKKYGLETAKNIKNKRSGLEIKLEKLLIDLNINFKTEYKIGNYRVDFKIDNLLIEANGLYWHSEINKTKEYHYNKYNFLNKKGYKSIFFYEDEILNKIDICKSIILYYLNKSQIIFLKNYHIKKINSMISNTFLNNNHLNSYKDNTSYGLFVKNELLSVLQYTKINNDIIINRFGYKNNIIIDNGLSKFILFLEQKYKNCNIIYLLDRRYQDNTELLQNNFVLHNTIIDFKWIDWLKSYNSDDILKKDLNKYNKIWDCGQAQYIKYNN